MTHAAALYCRLSPRPDGRYEGVDQQERWGRDYAASAWPDLPIEVFADSGVSAANGDHRPEFERFRRWVADGRIARVWAVEQSRLERREVEWFQLAAELDAAGIGEVHTNRDGVLRVRDEVAGIRAVLAAGEVRKLRRRVNDRLDAIAAEGRPAGSVMFGYRHGLDDDGKKTLLIVPEQADAVRWAADKVLSGWSLSNVARELTAQGLRGAHGGTITAGSVRKMVTNATAAGYRVHRGRTVGRGVWQPILEPDTWRAVRRRLSHTRTVARSDGGSHPIGPAALGSRTGRKYILTGGLAVCGVCGRPLVGTVKQYRSGKRQVTKPYLLCSPSRGGRGCVGIMLPETEQHVVDELFAELDKPEFLAAISADDHAPRRDEIDRALQDIERQRDELAEVWAMPGELTMSEWRTARRALGEHEQLLRSELATSPPGLAGVDIGGARAAWPAMTLDERREFIRLFVEQVTVNRAPPGTRAFDPGRIEIGWRQL